MGRGQLRAWAAAAVVAAGAGGAAPARPAAAGDEAATNAAQAARAPDGWSTVGPSFWIDRQLELIRRDRPWPTAQARNLFHASAAMHDAWAAYEPGLSGVLVDLDAGTVPPDLADRLARISIGYAALEVLHARYARTNRDGLALLKLSHKLDAEGLGGPLDGLDAQAAELGRRIGREVLALTLDDGSNETAEYDDNTGFQPANQPIDARKPGVGTLADPDRWQPLVVRGRTQECVTPQWGRVRPFAIARACPDRPYLDPGPPPTFAAGGHALVAAAAVELVMLSSRLDGRADPLTNQAAATEGDYGRVCAEYWEAGLATETPPGMWNAVAIAALDRERAADPTASSLAHELDVLLSLNAALHDAAVACWDIKMFYNSARPITFVRYMAGLGQSSDPRAQGYDPLGLPLVPGLIEVVSAESSAPGQRHERLAAHVGKVAVRCWMGTPDKQTVQTSGVDWALGTEWKPYQNRNFVTPAFPGYVSGHSTFSAAAATVLEHWFGPQIPGGPTSYTAPAGAFLKFEHGPAADVTLSWSTFEDLLHQAGRSRVWGGIHPCYDDMKGRQVGRAAAEAVLAKLGVRPVADH